MTRWVLITLAIAAWICIAVYLFTGLGWEIGGPISAALAGIAWWMGMLEKPKK